MPLFIKTYRVLLIFKVTITLEIQTIEDQRLFLYVLACLLFDIVLLFVFTALEPDSMNEVKGELVLEEIPSPAL